MHADQPMAAVGHRTARPNGGVADHDLERRLTEPQVDPRVARPVAGSVGEALLEDPVRRTVDGSLESSRRSYGGDRHVEARRGAMSYEGVQRRQPRRRRDLLARRALVAQRADDLIDLGHGVSRQVLDPLQGRSSATGILVVAQPRGAGPQGDDVDRVARGVVEITGDAGALLGGSEATLALGLALGTHGAP